MQSLSHTFACISTLPSTGAVRRAVVLARLFFSQLLTSWRVLRCNRLQVSQVSCQRLASGCPGRCLVMP